MAEGFRLALFAFLYGCRVVHISFSALTYPKVAGIFKENSKTSKEVLS
jgi:hypothetical protein